MNIDISDIDGDSAPAAVGPYRVLRELGRGAMGVVYEGEHGTLGRRVAIKALHSSLRGNTLAETRFAREARTASRLDHPNIVAVVDAGRSAVGSYLVMERIDGPTLAGWLRETGPLATEAALALLLPIISALNHAHAAGVVHRDVKPSNILLARDRFGEIVPKLGDFGIGKLLNDEADRSLTKDGFLGSPAYMAPEQVHDSRSVDPRADQYALAVVFYEACAGQLPFRAEGSYALMQAICRGGSPRLDTVAPGVASAVADILERAMSVNPADRYPSMQEMGRDLVTFAPGRSWGVWAREFVRDGDVPLRDATIESPVVAGVARPAARTSSRRAPGSRTAATALAGMAIGAAVATATLHRRVEPGAPALASSSIAAPLPLSEHNEDEHDGEQYLYASARPAVAAAETTNGPAASASPVAALTGLRRRAASPQSSPTPSPATMPRRGVSPKESATVQSASRGANGAPIIDVP